MDGLSRHAAVSLHIYLISFRAQLSQCNDNQSMHFTFCQEYIVEHNGFIYGDCESIINPWIPKILSMAVRTSRRGTPSAAHSRLAMPLPAGLTDFL